MDDLPSFVETFAALDRARLTRLDEAARARQLDARQVLQQYLDALWEDVQRSGERPEIGEKYRALAIVRELTGSLTDIAFDAVYDPAHQDPPRHAPGGGA